MRRALIAALFVLSSVGMLCIPAGADDSSGSNVVISFDFSDNSVAASATNGPFNIIADVFPEHLGGIVRMVAIAPAGSGSTNLVCPFQAEQQSQVECAFNFTTNGVWSIKAQFSTDKLSDVAPVSITTLLGDVSSVSITNLRVTN